MDLFIVFVLLAAAVVLLALVFSGRMGAGGKKAKAKKSAAPKRAGEVVPGCCPLCGTQLLGGEKINSVVFQGGRDDDRLCHIKGCPHCLPPESAEIRRVCPVCKKDVPQKGHLVARMFLRKDKSRHVHILGCTECRKK